MSPPWTRRAILQTVPAATGIGLAGCGGSDGPSPYGIEIRNKLTQADFETTEKIEGTTPVTVHVRVENGDSDQESADFKETVEVPTNTTKTFDDAFTIQTESTRYSMVAEMDPLVEGGLSSSRTRRASHSFTPENSPRRNPIPIIIQNQNAQAEDPELSPNIYISPG